MYEDDPPGIGVIVAVQWHTHCACRAKYTPDNPATYNPSILPADQRHGHPDPFVCERCAADVAWHRPPTDPCQAGTVGCSTNHNRPDMECHVW